MEGFSQEALLDFLKRNLFLTGVSFIGLVLLIAGFFFLQETKLPEDSVVFEGGASDSGQSRTIDVKTASTKSIMVDVSGAVNKPGVYEVPSDARVQDVLAKAGGLADEADAQGIAKSVNLASRVADGMKLYFPFTGEAGVLGITSSTSTTGLMGGSGSTVSGGLININLASPSELESLPGIGEVTAKKIIMGRPYGSIDDLKDKKIIGNSVFDKIKGLVSVN